MTERRTRPPLPAEELDYELPPERIAVRPAEPRDSARMMVVRRSTDDVEHARVRDLPSYLRAGDVLVFNTTAVAPARLVGRRADTGGRVEGLFLGETSAGTWRAFLTSNGRLRPGQVVELLDAGGVPTAVTLELVERDAATWTLQVNDARPAQAVLESVGRTPLPPYIRRARRVIGEEMQVDDAADRAWYQTVYADPDRRGSVAAPTAGLHFTAELLETLRATRVERLDVTLHVGPGTFAPIETATVDEHPMHTEWFEVPAETVRALSRRNSTESGGSRGQLIAVGTTTVRALESLPERLPATTAAITGETDLLIAPGDTFHRVDGMLTNFHLPRSTLLALVGAMIGLERLLALYDEAMEHGYRFYSYGDAMLILP